MSAGLQIVCGALITCLISPRNSSRQTESHGLPSLHRTQSTCVHATSATRHTGIRGVRSLVFAYTLRHRESAVFADGVIHEFRQRASHWAIPLTVPMWEYHRSQEQEAIDRPPHFATSYGFVERSQGDSYCGRYVWNEFLVWCVVCLSRAGAVTPAPYPRCRQTDYVCRHCG